ncbi:MAG: DNA recombination protein RmuC [Eubacterium sp.]
MTIVIMILALAAVAVSILILLKTEQMRRDLDHYPQETDQAVRDAFHSYSEGIWRNMRDASDLQNERLEELDKKFRVLEMTNEQKLDNIRNMMAQQLSTINASLNDQMTQMNRDNTRHLDQMRQTVDEKLQKTLEERIGQSFQLVNRQLEQVSRGLGEMQNLARGVGDLKKVLSNVKTRGNLGEIQLGAILDDILAPEQYETNVNTKGTGREFVEFAVKLPGNGDHPVWLPIDSKFPADSYVQLTDAYEAGDAEAVKNAKSQLIRTMKNEAKDIREKYVAPPKTTDFGILFLPSEGLYAEALRLGMAETLQREYKVSIAGPTTMAALLNSLQMGFKTLAIQERSSQVWETLAAVKTEFAKFEDELLRAQKNIDQVNERLNRLVGVRTRAVRKTLDQVGRLDEEAAEKILHTEDEDRFSRKGQDSIMQETMSSVFRNAGSTDADRTESTSGQNDQEER